ncbi:hypothetical protein TVAG_270840 [Trichomonas vaginalis G3]|uniref:Uncharacterized protein n=1 Tax=Trichomonas vaginalis (strain ATCC PRA-98 / G3) TaxID=412133 RepID=A2FIH6_TRIV3|nr:hypothetical protein TVAGG3_0014830 [Trichomonas vaginalis G3]EAX95293.1 hypothetical protein TVAG_270840 [Trichomonas vaginalis G3]KAI5539350.1 hypothetical protein TVAGG3_0014830 [Trichomonas vaginalis G3]|eukprot:XP_001308223.1 hypothetical protein [Trichomonas vaginalis G3]
MSRVIENDKIPEYPNVAIRPRSPRKVYLKEKSKILPDFNAAEHLAPQIYFDRDTITKLIEEEKPENLTVMRKLSCFNQSLGDFDDNSKHFVLSKPKNVFGTSETENGEFVTVLPLKEDPPPLIEVPPFIQQDRNEPNFIIPPVEEDIPASSKVYPPCPSSPRGQRPHSPSVRKRREFLNTLTTAAETNQNVPANDFQKPKIINPSTSIGKTRFGSLVKLFSQVHKKKNRNSMKSFV